MGDTDVEFIEDSLGWSRHTVPRRNSSLRVEDRTMMTADEIVTALDSLTQDYPERIDGTTIAADVSRRFEGIVGQFRLSTIEALRGLISVRPRIAGARRLDDPAQNFRMWVASRIAADYKLVELRPAIQALLVDIRERRTFLPYHEELLRGTVGSLLDGPDASQ